MKHTIFSFFISDFHLFISFKYVLLLGGISVLHHSSQQLQIYWTSLVFCVTKDKGCTIQFDTLRIIHALLEGELIHLKIVQYLGVNQPEIYCGQTDWQGSPWSDCQSRTHQAVKVYGQFLALLCKVKYYMNMFERQHNWQNFFA